MLELLQTLVPLAAFLVVYIIFLGPIIIQNIRRWRFKANLKRHILYSGVSNSVPSNANTENFYVAMMYASHHRRFFITASGHFGVGPSTMQPGDLVVILCDVALPFVLRQDGDEFRLIGACYVHGIMFGEVSKALEASDWEELYPQSFVIH